MLDGSPSRLFSTIPSTGSIEDRVGHRCKGQHSRVGMVELRLGTPWHGAPMPLPTAQRHRAFFSTQRRTESSGASFNVMSDAFDYFRAFAVRALCRARSMPPGRMKHLQLAAGRIYNLLKKEAAYSPNTHHLDDFRTARKLEASLEGAPATTPPPTEQSATMARRHPSR